MAITTYAAFAERMIGKYEGGYGWNRKDPGGPTKYGITCGDLAEHLGQKMDSMERWAPIVKAMTLETAEQIYKTKYANAIRYNDLPAGVDVVMFDYGVNSGIGRPIRVARAILGLPAGPRMDTALLDALKKTSPNKFIENMCAERLHFMHGIRGGSAWAEFGGGWGARVADLKAYALHLAAAPGTVANPIAPDLTTTSIPKAQHGDPEVTTKTIKKVVVGGAASGSSPLAGVPWELAACLAGFVIVGGIAYVVHHKQMAAMANATVVLPAAA
jgi:lysozyme family protein